MRIFVTPKRKEKRHLGEVVKQREKSPQLKVPKIEVKQEEMEPEVSH
jgi:hypothetical protein